MSTDYEWRHGWIPLTMRAALQKTRGDHEAAAKLLGEARARRRGRRREFVSPSPRHRAEHAERARWAALTDDDLAGALDDAGDDEAAVGRIVAELDRRDAAERKAQRARERRAARRSAEELRRGQEFDAACDAGEDPEEAYSRVYGVTAERIRRDEAISSLRAAGYKGRGLAELAREAHRGHVEVTFWHAEEECRGTMLNKAGRAAGVDPRSLFTGPESRARKYASEELMTYWHEHGGRLTVDDFTAGLLGGQMRAAGSAAWA